MKDFVTQIDESGLTFSTAVHRSDAGYTETHSSIRESQELCVHFSSGTHA